MTIRRRTGFTPIEILAVISILGILIALLLPAIQSVRSSAANSSCQNKMRQIGLAFHGFEGARHHFPGAATEVAPGVKHNWATYLLPYLEANEVYRQYDFAINWQAAANLPATRTTVPVFLCPANSTAPRFDTRVGGAASTPKAVSDYAPITAVHSFLSVHLGFTPATFPVVNRVGAIGSDTVTNVEQIRLSDMIDGTSRTIMLVEDTDRPNVWRKQNLAAGNVGGAGWADANSGFDLHGTDKATALATRGSCLINCHNSNEIYSFHRSGCNFLMCDGSVHPLRREIDPFVLIALVTRRNSDRTGSPADW